MRYKHHITFIILFLLFGLGKLEAQEEKYIGLFIYNFTHYFEWPETNKNDDFVIEVIGHESVYKELLRLTAGKKVGNRDFSIRNFNSPEGTGNCQIIFVGHWHTRLLPEILTKVADSPTLVITESEGLLDKGSCINFVIRDGTIKFEMNATNVQKKQLKTDPRLRELALRVVD